MSIEIFEEKLVEIVPILSEAQPIAGQLFGSVAEANAAIRDIRALLASAARRLDAAEAALI